MVSAKVIRVDLERGTTSYEYEEIGQHFGCGGPVAVLSNLSAGGRFCHTCAARGVDVVLQSERRIVKGVRQ